MKRTATDPNAPKRRRDGPPKTFNWNGLPAELKAKCIQKMDFVSRMRLAGLSHTENNLVLANPYHWDYLEIQVVYSQCVYTVDVIGKSKLEKRRMQMSSEEKYTFSSDEFSEYEVEEISEEHKAAVERLERLKRENELYEEKEKRFRMSEETLSHKFGTILKYSEIELLKIELIKENYFVPFGPEHGPFRIKNIVSKCDYDTTRKYVKMNSFPLENIIIEHNYGSCQIGELVDLPQIRSAKLVKLNLGGEDMGNDVPDIFNKWIERDAPIGQKMYVNSPGDDIKPAVDQLAEAFERRVVQKTTSAVRISTDNPDKHVLFHFKFAKNLKGLYYPRYFVATVISSSEAIPEEYPEAEDLPGFEVPSIRWSTRVSKTYAI